MVFSPPNKPSLWSSCTPLLDPETVISTNRNHSSEAASRSMPRSLTEQVDRISSVFPLFASFNASPHSETSPVRHHWLSCCFCPQNALSKRAYFFTNFPRIYNLANDCPLMTWPLDCLQPLLPLCSEDWEILRCRNAQNVSDIRCLQLLRISRPGLACPLCLSTHNAERDQFCCYDITVLGHHTTGTSPHFRHSQC